MQQYDTSEEKRKKKKEKRKNILILYIFLNSAISCNDIIVGNWMAMHFSSDQYFSSLSVNGGGE